MSKIWLILGILVLFMPVVFAQEELIVKSDSSWKVTASVSSVDWMQPSFDDSTWGSSAGNWNNGPCSVNCGKIKSCDVGCNEWMWSGEACVNCSRYFRKFVNVPGEIISASITISADDYYWLYVNGKLVGTTAGKKVSYALSDNYDITNYLHNGVNVIAIKVDNAADYEGVVVNSDIRYKTTDPLLIQLQSQVDNLQTQVSKLTDDKTRLQSQVDSLTKEENDLTASKEQLLTQVGNLQLQNTNLNTNLEQANADAGRYRTFTLILFIALLVVLVALLFCIYYIYERSKKRPPAISQPLLEKKSTLSPIQKTVAPQTGVPHQKTVIVNTLREEGRSSGSKLFP